MQSSKRQQASHLLLDMHQQAQATFHGGCGVSMVALFAMSCCVRQIIHGRFMGQDGAVITKSSCPFGCVIRNKKDGVAIRFVEYKTESMVSPELRKRWKYGQSGDLWPKYNREWLKRKEAVDQGRAPEPKAKGKNK
jgi:hypothetical protein